VVPDCVATSKCTIGSSPNCQRLKDRFLAVQAGITDERDELQGKIHFKQQFCEEQSLSFTEQIESMNENLRKTQANLATATEDQNLAESGSHQKAAQHELTAKEYTDRKAVCCETQNTAESELCALEKIRGELMKMEGDPVFISDCVVSDWMDEECSATCGGGFGIQTRGVIVQPEGGGVTCPPLRDQRNCNMDACPVDCKVDDWSGWTSCSAECGGGVMERSRNVLVQAQHDGEPCEPGENEIACNIQNCDKPCVLSDWTSFTQCSKSCSAGSHRRFKTVMEEAVGQGGCPDPQSEERLHIWDHSCNQWKCRSPVTCNSKVDVVIVIDGSASLGQEGWKNSKSLTGKLVGALTSGTRDARVAVELFSGPKDWDDYLGCTGGSEGKTIDMKVQCGIEWVSHFSNDTQALNASAQAMDWPQSTTLTSVALGQAEAELVHGREDAQSVVVVITDGVPMSQRNTRSASMKLIDQGVKMLWVPVGNKAPLDLIKELASLPVDEHVIQIGSFSELGTQTTIDDIVSSICPVLI